MAFKSKTSYDTDSVNFLEGYCISLFGDIVITWKP